MSPIFGLSGVIKWGAWAVLAFFLVSCNEAGERDNPMDPGSARYVTPSSSSSEGGASSSSNGLVEGECRYTEGVPYGTLVCAEQTYKTIKRSSFVGLSVTLMAENLNEGTLFHSWAVSDYKANDTLIEKFCDSCSLTGGLYQWAEAMGLPSRCNTEDCDDLIDSVHHQGICPTGWHIPMAYEWSDLANILGGTEVAGQKMKLNNTGYRDWDSTYNDGNIGGVSAYPSGYLGEDGFFYAQGNSTFFWSANRKTPWPSSIDMAGQGIVYGLNYSSPGVFLENKSKIGGYSVRCFKND